VGKIPFQNNGRLKLGEVEKNLYRKSRWSSDFPEVCGKPLVFDRFSSRTLKIIVKI
jgi:hypothetical protein